jgi:hypothetical protein
MPYGNGTGPSGMGSRTGRGFGFCSGFPYPGYSVGPGFGRGLGWRAGFRLGFGPFDYSFPEPYDYSPDQEKDFLKHQISAMEKTIENLKTRLDEVDKKE